MVNHSHHHSRLKYDVANIHHHFIALYQELKMFFKESKERLQDLIATNFDLGLHHFKQGNIADATFRFKLVIYFKPTYLTAYYYLAKCMIIKNNQEKAIQILKKSIEKGYGCEQSVYLLATLDKNQPHPENIPLTIIENYFNNIALELKKSNIIEADHSKAKILFKICSEIVNQENKSITDIIDLGCGSGISSLYFKEKFPDSNITGVDLSLEMINISKKLNIKSIPIFDNLIKTNLIEFLNITSKKFDLIIASDSLHYHKELVSILNSAKKCLNAGGMMAFSIEKSDSFDLELNHSMQNYCFHRQFIETSIKQAEFHQLHMSEHKINDDKNYWYVVISANSI